MLLLLVEVLQILATRWGWAMLKESSLPSNSHLGLSPYRCDVLGIVWVGFVLCPVLVNLTNFT